MEDEGLTTDPVRAIEHIGITVPNIDEASAFLVAAFGAEVIYVMSPDPDRATGGTGPDSQSTLGIRPGAVWKSSQMLKLGNGPSIELFEYEDTDQREAVIASDFGLQHFALYVDDMETARQRVIDAGGTPLVGPSLLPGIESGKGNMWLYTLSPWGSIIELVSFPSSQPYEQTTPLRRWRPDPK
jgi:catechol 2,3-dioxygenase-like lactoylglutathione lyase family enzyme